MSQIDGKVERLPDIEPRCFTLQFAIEYPLRHCLPLSWPEFNRRAKLYFREVVERNRK